MYLMLCIRSNISYVVGLASRYQGNPGVKYWQAVKKIFRYLKHTKHLKLCFQANELEVIGYSDAYFLGDRDGCKSTSRHVILFGGAAASWTSKKQACVAKYTQKIEYVACSIVTTFVVWIKRF